jgi:hypothetical protein
MSGFDQLNEELGRQGGSYAKLNKVDCAPVDGRVIDVQVRDKIYDGVILTDKNNNPRKEWVFEVDTKDGTVKVSLGESGQITVKDEIRKLSEKAGEPVQIKPGGTVHFHVLEDSKPGKAQAKIAFKYTPPKAQTIAADEGDEELPF